MNRLPITTLQRWRNNASVLAEHVETLRLEIARKTQGRENSELLRTYAGECKVAAREMVMELDRLMDLQALDAVKKSLQTATVESAESPNVEGMS